MPRVPPEGYNFLQEVPGMRKNYVVTLNPEERENLEKLVSTGRTSAKRQTHGRILLKADAGLAGPGWTDEQICAALDVSPATVARVRKRFLEEGLEAVTHPSQGTTTLSLSAR